jgi:hypothetical protein
MDLTEGSEMSAQLNLTPVKYPKENIQDTKNLSNNSSHCCKWMDITVGSGQTAQLLTLLPVLP